MTKNKKYGNLYLRKGIKWVPGIVVKFLFEDKLQFKEKSMMKNLKILKQINYEGKVLFKDYMEFVYSRRSALDDTSDKLMKTILKFLMNSVYGKFA